MRPGQLGIVFVNKRSSAVDEHFCDLDGVQGGTLQELVAANEDVETALVVSGDVLADAADEHVVHAGGFHGHRIDLVLGIVAELDAGRGGEDGARLLGRDLVLEFKIDGLGMCAHHGDADAGAGNLHVRKMHDLARLIHHLHLFLGVAVRLEDIDVREEVERNLLSHDLDFRGLALKDRVGLLHELVHGFCAAA